MLGPCSEAAVTPGEDVMKGCLLALQVLPRDPAPQRHTQEALSSGARGSSGATLGGIWGSLQQLEAMHYPTWVLAP